jgi:hypothetical protein
MKSPDLEQILAAEAILRPYINDPKISVTALALQVVTAYLDAAPDKKKRPGKSNAIAINDPVFISLPTNQDRVFYCVHESQFQKFVLLYPAVDIAQHLRNMEGWLIHNRSNAKTLTGMPSFINRWLAKEQNRSKPNGHGKPSNNDNWLAGAADLAAELRSNGK